MHWIPPRIVALLRAQGVTDSELDELRRTGRVERTSADGTTKLAVELDDFQAPDRGRTSLDPAVLQQLQRSRGLLPADALDELEELTGTDLDGDGRIGTGDDATSRSHAPTSNVDGPFVHKRSGGSALWILLALVAVGAVAYLLLR